MKYNKSYIGIIFLILFAIILASGCAALSGMNSLPNNGQIINTELPTEQVTYVTENSTPYVTCRQGLTNCDGFCRDLAVDIGNCGSCGNVCSSGERCTASQCAGSVMQGSTQGSESGSSVDDCTRGSLCDGVCTDITSDPANCGGCGNICPSDQFCSGSSCVGQCPAGLSACSGWCIDKNSDTLNCGSCDNQCSSGQVCSTGQCMTVETSCSEGLTDCAGSCANLLTDDNNCGSCGTTCTGLYHCNNGQCQITAPAPNPVKVNPMIVCTATGKLWCSGTCVDQKTDNNNCGSCGTTCPTGKSCSGGICSCPTGYYYINGACRQKTVIDPSTIPKLCLSPNGLCDGSCVDLQTDVNNCGSCGHKCAINGHCSNGECHCQSGYYAVYMGRCILKTDIPSKI
jgi:hypothetical protein